MSGTKQRLKTVWLNSEPKRYVPHSYNGGTGWGVFDRKLNRFVDGDLKTIPLETLRDEIFAN